MLGSTSVLNTKPHAGRAASADSPCDCARSPGDGRYRTTASSNAGTPRFFRAAPNTTGTARPPSVARRTASCRCAAWGVSFVAHTFITESSSSASVATRCSRAAAKPEFTGSASATGPVVIVPLGAKCSSRRSTRSTSTPSARSHCNGSGRSSSRSRRSFRQRSIDAPGASSLLTKTTLGTRWCVACRHTLSVCGSTPRDASSTTMAPSSTRSERSTSMAKSTWPGVSMSVSRWGSRPSGCQTNEDAAAEMVMPCFFSSASWSSVVLPW